MNDKDKILDIKTYYSTCSKEDILDKSLTAKLSRIEVLIDSYLKAGEEDKNIRPLNNLYWEIVQSAVNNRVLAGSLRGLHFSDSEKMLIDFGWLDERIFSLEEGEKKKLLADYIPEHIHVKPKTERVIYYFSEWVNLEYARLLNIDHKHDLEKREQAIADALKTIPDRIIDMQRARNNIASASLHSEELSEITKNIEKNTTRFYSLIKKRDFGGGFTPPERQEFSELQYLMEKWKDRKYFLLQDLTKVGDDKRIHDLDKEIERCFIINIDLKEELEQLRGEILKDVERRESVMEQGKSGTGLLFALVSRSVELAVLCAKRSYRDPWAVLSGNRQVLSREAVESILDMIEDLDPGLFDNFKTTVTGKPSFFIIPGTGNGLYDFKMNSIIIPSSPANSIEEAIIYGLIDYRISVDEDQELETKYYELHPELKSMGMVKFRRAFVKDYLIWILKEGKGMMVFKSEEREWFEREIAPKPNALRIPRKLRERLKTTDGLKGLEEEAHKALDADKNDVRACLIIAFCALSNEKRDLAADYFQKVINLSPEHLLANYNLALVYEMEVKRSEAAQQWQKYVRLDKGSWWRNNAQKRAINLRTR